MADEVALAQQSLWMVAGCLAGAEGDVLEQAMEADGKMVWEELVCPKFIHSLKHFYFLFQNFQQFFL